MRLTLDNRFFPCDLVKGLVELILTLSEAKEKDLNYVNGDPSASPQGDTLHNVILSVSEESLPTYIEILPLHFVQGQDDPGFK